MKTVPTLCATATVVGVSAVGYALGRPPNSPTNKRKVSSDPQDYSMATEVATRLTNTPTASSLFSLTHSGYPPSSGCNSHDGRPPSRKIRRLTDEHTGSSHKADAGYEATSVVGHDSTDFDPRASLRSRSYWMKRLSSFSSHNSSHTSTSRPASPSVTYSTGSATFSHSGSAAPIFGQQTPNPLPPNKLVKRSSSQRVAVVSRLSSGSRITTLRRPATSHQRSATLQSRSRPLEVSAEELWATDTGKSQHLDTQQLQWRQYFTAKVGKQSGSSKKRTSNGEPEGIKRVLPDAKYRPTLVMAESLAASSVEVDESLSQDDESVFFKSRPVTPIGIENVLSSPVVRPTTSSDERTGIVPDKEGTEGLQGRRSFSLSDLLSIGPSSRKSQSSKQLGSKFLRRSRGRVSSAPLPAMGRKEGDTADAEKERPAKRRDITYPTPSNHNVHLASIENIRAIDVANSDKLPCTLLSNVPASRSPNNFASAHDSIQSLPSHDQPSPGSTYPSQFPPSPTIVHSTIRPSQYSAAPSEQASTLVGSDNEARGVGSGDEDDTDFASETLFDSLRTRTTRSVSGARRPRIETIFDESPPQASGKRKIAALQDLLPRGSFQDLSFDLTKHQSITEEQNYTLTPIQTIKSDRLSSIASSAARRSTNSSLHPGIPSSPPDMLRALNLGKLEWDPRMEEDDDDRWSFSGDEGQGTSKSVEDNATNGHRFASAFSSKPNTSLLLASGATSTTGTPRHLSADQAIKDRDRDARSSIFDWSEQPTDNSPGNRTPPRPKTVHGKKNAEGRGSRSVGRRAPSALHARSQSVPVVPDVAGKRDTVVTNKFGTWGVGSKGVTEDWNDDFDFSDFKGPNADLSDDEERRIDSGVAMVVPQTIREQQTNVLANIGLLREWGLLIEELKELRMRAIFLGVLESRPTDLWKQVDAMIDLADQEVDEPTIAPRLSPPSSPGFDLDAFDEEPGATASNSRPRRRSGLSSSDRLMSGIPSLATHTKRQSRKSILSPDNDIFGAVKPDERSSEEERTQNAEKMHPSTRPRKDSEAVARSVIEALQNRYSNSEPFLTLPPVSPAKKVPFDTATLKHIVPYVHGLMRKVKDVLREAEGLYSSPARNYEPQEPRFNQIFRPQPEGSPSARRPRRSRTNNGSTMPDDSLQGLENELTNQMKLMTVT